MGLFLLIGAAGVLLYAIGSQPVKQTDDPRQTPGVPKPATASDRAGRILNNIATAANNPATMPIVLPIQVMGEWVNAVLDNWGGVDIDQVRAGRERYRELARTIATPTQAGFPVAFYNEDPGMTLQRARQLLYFMAWHFWTSGSDPLFNRLSVEEQATARAEGQYPGVKYIPGRGTLIANPGV